MLQNTLMKINTLLKESKFSQYQIDGLLETFSHYKKGMWIYPAVFIRKYNLSVKQVYNFLEKLVDLNILKSYYELYCSNCHKSTGEVYEVFNQIPDTFECVNCDCELNGIENAIIIYRVVEE